MEKDKELLIEAYFADSLTATQRKQLDWLLQHDAAFLEAFDFEKEIRDTVIYNKRQTLKERFRTLDKRAVKPMRKWAGWWYAAACILVVAVSAWFFWGRQSEATPEKLFTQYMEPYPNMVTPNVRSAVPADSLLSEALALYDKQAYAQAALLLKKVYDEHPTEPVVFYLAICHQLLNQPAETIKLLEARRWENAVYFSPTVVNWYLGLAFLQQGDRDEALRRFKLVAEAEDSLSYQATEIIHALGSR